MTDDPFEELRGFEFMQSRIPILDALSTFVPKNTEPSAEIMRELNEHAQSRWYPLEDGCRVLVPHDGSDFNATLFKVEPGAWDHDTCDVCRVRIPAMTLCWVTASGYYKTLCVDCMNRMRNSGPTTLRQS